ncbi:hypothetical protein [Aeromicrobium sp. UC242_57]|uniref:hypothetical protein n=1 Tax=Aeromicrobium sp. UC242_57 TaxID=3374624 RepID=UPI0037A84866
MIHGDVSTFLQALGAREGDPRLEQALAFVGGEPETETFHDEQGESKYLIMPGRGVDFLLKDGVLDTVFIYAVESVEQGVYGGWSTLVDGVGADASTDDVVRVLGAPRRATSGYACYQVDPGFVQFDFDDDRLTMAVVMRHDIGG